MVRTFGLQKPVCLPDADAAREGLDANDQRLFEIAQQMADVVRSMINENAARLQTVDQRLRTSVNGHIRRNVALLKPVVQGLVDSVNIPLDHNQAIINGVAATPEVQDLMRQVPPSPAYDGTIPQLPPVDHPQQQTGAMGVYQSLPGQQVPMLPMASTAYVILLDCQGLQAIALREVNQPAIQAAQAAGWVYSRLYPPLTLSDESAVTAWMLDNAPALAQECLAHQKG